MVGSVGIADVVRTGKHDDAQIKKLPLLTYPLQHLEAVHSGHLDVQQNQSRKRVFFAVTVGWSPLQICNSIHPARDCLNATIQTSPLERSQNKRNVVLV